MSPVTPAFSPESSLEHATAQQRIAADPASSVWVSANAGTGKTRVLIDRISRLLLSGVAPEKILCLTFTKAAAAEMENRLSARLGKWAVMADGPLGESLFELLGTAPVKDDLLRARRLFAESLEAPGGLKIRTIHAFCESLLGRFPIEAQVAPHVSVMDERAQAELMAEARERVYRHAFDNAGSDIAMALDAIAGLLDEGSFDDILNELLNKRERLKHAHERLGSVVEMDRAIRAHLGLGADESHDAVLRAGAEDDAFDRAGLITAIAALQTGGKGDQERAPTIADWLSADADERGARLEQDYLPIFLTKEGTPRVESGIITKKPREQDPAAAEALFTEQVRVHTLAEKLKATGIARDTGHLVRVGTAVIERYEELKRARALMDYDDLILKALTLLQRDRSASWVHFKLDGGIDHILVDEAQDTSPAQWQVIRHLADEFFSGEGTYESDPAHPDSPPPRTIFAVGDKKQSIYSFQGADPRGFARMHDYFQGRALAAGANWRPVELVQSFRTTSAVLNVVDAVFQRPEAQGGVTDQNGTRHHAQRQHHGGVVEVWPAFQRETVEEPGPWDAPVDRIRSSSPMARTAESIARTIARWCDQKEVLESKDRPITPGDIMILVPKRGQFAEEMVRRLKARGIPVAGSDRMILSEQIAIVDLMAAARFALLPEDDLTLAILLKGPFIGFSEEELFALAHDRPGSPETGTLWQALKNHDTPAARDAQGVLGGLLALADFCPPFEFFSRLLGPGKGRRTLLARLGPEANDPIDEFLAQTIAFERDHVSSLQGFLAWFEAGGTDIKRDMDTGRGQVRVMTVHGSKGLEANIVILPDTCSEPGSATKDRVLWTTPADEILDEDPADPALPLWPGVKTNETEHCSALRDHMKEARLEEYRRLLYVAMTRARDRLYVMGWERGKRSDRKEHGRDEGSWYELIRPAMAGLQNVRFFGSTPDEGFGFTTPQTAEPETEETADLAAAAMASPPEWLVTPPAAEPEPFQPLSPSRPDGEEPPVMPPFSGDDTTRFRRGNLIHRLLQTLPEVPPPQRLNAAQNWLRQTAADLDESTRNALANETLSVLETPEFKDVFGPGSLPEVAIAGTVDAAAGPRTIAGQVDRLLVTDHTVTIIDYKTNRPPPRTESDVPETYLRQMALYKSALELIYPKRVIRCLLVWTDGPNSMVLDNAQLDLYTP